MTSFEDLVEIVGKRFRDQPENSRTVELLNQGVHAIGKKIVEEAAEVWMAAEYEGKKRTTEEIAQLLYHLVVLMQQQEISIQELEAEL
jgi:phosphoribosyl-ATP pyrophosphohydrolase